VPSWIRLKALGAVTSTQWSRSLTTRGRRRKVLTYLASPAYIDDNLKPYAWYKDFVLAGARKHCLPSEYLAEYVERVEAIDDPDKVRDKRQRATPG
jgi:hypothetical protein